VRITQVWKPTSKVGFALGWGGGGWGGGGMAEASVSMRPWVNSILADRSKICLGNLSGHHTWFSLGFGAR